MNSINNKWPFSTGGSAEGCNCHHEPLSAGNILSNYHLAGGMTSGDADGLPVGFIHNKQPDSPLNIEDNHDD